MGKELGIEGSGEARSRAPFELKDLAGPTGTIGLTPNEKRVAEDRRDCYWLYVVTDCDTRPRLHVHRDPARLPWHEACLPRRHTSRRRQVKNVDHYYLSVDAMTQPMRVRNDSPNYGKPRNE